MSDPKMPQAGKAQTTQTGKPSASQEKPKPPAPQEPATAEELQEMFRRLSPQDRARLAREGYVFPAHATAHSMVVKYGYQCERCMEIGLEFLGEQFLDPGNGEYYDLPPLHLSIQQLPWRQPRMPDGKVPNRREPFCQHCFCTLIFEQDGRLRVKYLKEIVPWTETRDRRLAEMRAKRPNGAMLGMNLTGQRETKTGDVMHQHDGGSIDLSEKTTSDIPSIFSYADQLQP
jgi:hypothetical protein